MPHQSTVTATINGQVDRVLTRYTMRGEDRPIANGAEGLEEALDTYDPFFGVISSFWNPWSGGKFDCLY